VPIGGPPYESLPQMRYSLVDMPWSLPVRIRRRPAGHLPSFALRVASGDWRAAPLTRLWARSLCLWRGALTRGWTITAHAAGGEVEAGHPLCRRARTSRADQASGAKVVLPVGSSTFAPEAWSAPCGWNDDRGDDPAYERWRALARRSEWRNGIEAERRVLETAHWHDVSPPGSAC
jgi:hypothetical protein